jgi:hypothetical protein
MTIYGQLRQTATAKLTTDKVIAAADMIFADRNVRFVSIASLNTRRAS